MPEKKEQNKFTIQFNPADPTHRQIIDILNQQGRRKAQFIVNAVQHYLHCPETPEIPQPAPVNTNAVEDIVRRIIEEKYKPAVMQEPVKEHVRHPKNEGIHYDGPAELIGKDGLSAIVNTIAAFRKG